LCINYVEFFDIPNKPIYDISLISNDIRGKDLQNKALPIMYKSTYQLQLN
jgi:hypothetical protein